MTNYVRGQHFPFQDCFNRRVIEWNEPNYMSSAEDEIKMLTEGVAFSSACKYESNAIIDRTPVIMTSNNKLFENSPAFKSRIFFEHWTPCPQLKKYNQYPHPWTLILLFERFIFNNESIFLNF